MDSAATYPAGNSFHADLYKWSAVERVTFRFFFIFYALGFFSFLLSLFPWLPHSFTWGTLYSGYR
jgi:hypothetical protein